MEEIVMFMSNVRLEVADAPACFRFYRDVMGFPVSWGDENDTSYCSFKVSAQTSLAVHEYENNIAEIGGEVGMRPLAETVRGRETALLIFEIESREKLDACAEELRGRGAEIITGPADHLGWGISSFYLRDPDGNLIEINTQVGMGA
jgi:lactoylglutathione lyase